MRGTLAGQHATLCCLRATRRSRLPAGGNLPRRLRGEESAPRSATAQTVRWTRPANRGCWWFHMRFCMSLQSPPDSASATRSVYVTAVRGRCGCVEEGGGGQGRGANERRRPRSSKMDCNCNCDFVAAALTLRAQPGRGACRNRELRDRPSGDVDLVQSGPAPIRLGVGGSG